MATETSTSLRAGIDIDKPRWDQSTYTGRAKHFFATTNPLNLLRSNAELEEAKNIISKYRKGDVPEGLTEDKLWRYKQLYDSAYHPDTGEKMIVIGRMSAQVPMNMAITGCMLTFYKTTGQTVFWQWFNQSFNAVVNYTNRSGDSPIPVSQLVKSYCLATSGALATALTLNSLVKRFPPLIGRFVPLAAVAAANCVNIPMMRSSELIDGIAVFDENGEKIGNSKKMAQVAISQVVLSRILMAMPGMTIPPIIMDYIERRGVLKRMPWVSAPAQIIMCGFFLTFATPLCCAFFPQIKSVPVDRLEDDIKENLAKTKNNCKIAYYNKGL
ncbi:PREDICTED: sideroflexin-1-like [Rhagoletis zephyria]|uniref:sideroflexin-1-like n=1 Tax=Rhagoletis zephyria TaxID=28612 RepID=UPI0008118E68|nr:PREDICTED: sideroflexin-1-like [Rhagoletis zephyria]